MSFWSKIFGDANSRYVATLHPLVERINALEAGLQGKSDDDLRGLTAAFRERLSGGESLDDLLPEAFAAVREASRRTLGQRHFDVQLMGGVVLHRGRIAQMRTGEGKTLVATLPVYLNALTGKGVHVVTVNDYLSRRDAAWMGQIYHALGMSTGVLNHETAFVYDPAHKSEDGPEDRERDETGGFRVAHEFLRPVPRRQAYEADITYGTNNEFGFDYLRDNMVSAVRQMAQRPEHTHHFAIVDEVDSILIDEARTPLIISAPDEESGKLYQQFARAVPALNEETDYTVDEKRKAVSITDSGIEKVQQRLGLGDIYQEGGTRYVHHLEQALRAQVLFKRDRDYVVKDGQVVIVDEFTGRLMPGRRWSDGLHQAVEAKEGVNIQRESKTLATITFQNYFRLYDKLAGMTGTARTSAEEFHKVYKLDVVVVPTHRPMVRADLPDRIYKTENGKFRALVNEVRALHEKGQPVLVGTASIQKNEVIGALLTQAGIPHNVLNAKNHEREAEILAQAGRPGAVTVATNMAGRGVDIILGGNPAAEGDAAKVRELGGLMVLGTERHEARRIDDQLRGRAGRQGDPGASQFYVSCEDDLVRIFGGDRLKRLMDTLGVTEEDVIENRMVSRSIEQAQGRIEGHHFDARKYVLEYDDVMNRHRTAIYRLRHEVLHAETNRERMLEWLRELMRAEVFARRDAVSGTLDTEEVVESLKTLAPFPANLHTKLMELAPKLPTDSTDHVLEYLDEELERMYAAKEAEQGEQMRPLEKLVMLRAIDDVWVEHLEGMEHLRESVQLRAYGQRDPLVEYKIEAQKLYGTLLDTVRQRAAGIIFRVTVMRPQERRNMQERRPETEAQGTPAHPDSVHTEHVQAEHADKTGRNDPCPCGSGKKFKKCGLLDTEEHKRNMAGRE
ncbi:MAG TPA: preprotein translocase subunit SecA [Candidatus Paceibacterota bacterium]|nr:preprotein translocase subunit SecA [Candidatus Paceibacterota bacterium]